MLSEIIENFQGGAIDKWQFIDEMYKHHELLFEYSRLLASTNISSILIEDNRVLMTFRDSNLKFIVHEGDKRLAPFDTLNFGTYELEELNMQNKLIKDGMNILDIGGNYGWYAMHVASRFPSSLVHSFEPIPFTYSQLNNNISINNIKNIITYNIGFSDKSGSFDFYYSPELSVNASLAKLTDENKIDVVSCQVERLDDFIEKQSVAVDFIKCDVEGAELLVFKGGEHFLAEQKPIVFAEMLRKWTKKFGYHPNDIIDFFEKIGYSCFVSDGNSLFSFKKVDDLTVETNFFFLHTSHHSQIIDSHIA
jgi:FkbM family methyltransferase